jgi:hypothetical protein
MSDDAASDIDGRPPVTFQLRKAAEKANISFITLHYVQAYGFTLPSAFLFLISLRRAPWLKARYNVARGRAANMKGIKALAASTTPLWPFVSVFHSGSFLLQSVPRPSRGGRKLLQILDSISTMSGQRSMRSAALELLTLRRPAQTPHYQPPWIAQAMMASMLINCCTYIEDTR